jgi:ABC-type branched-subunit amino acid transport system ATPase component
MFGRRNARKEEGEMIGRAMLHLQTLGLAEVADKLAGDLSFGQQRLVEVARALFSQPKILFLDEPGAGLSAGEKATLMEILRETRQCQDQYIVLTDHSMDFIMTICDFITVMNFGRKIFEGTPRKYKRTPKSSMPTWERNRNMLRVDNIDVYYGKNRAIQNVSLRVEEGQLITLMGANGTGKTTILNCISGFLKQKRGAINYKGKRIDKFRAEQVVQFGISQVSQNRIFSVE